MLQPVGGSSSSPPDESTHPPQLPEMPSKLPGLRMAPLRQPVTSILNSPVSHQSETPPVSSTTRTFPAATSSLPERLPTLAEFLNAARTTDTELSSVNLDSTLPPPPPKTILPAFINLQAVENLPYAFDRNGSPKRRRLDVAGGDYFASDHLQLPVPQAQSDKKPRPFGPYAILNGLNEPPPNAALFPPIEPGSVRPILSKRKSQSTPVPSDQKIERPSDKRELRLEEILDPSGLDPPADEESANKPTQTEPPAEAGDAQANDEPLSPKTRGRSRKNLRPWTEQETTDLLKGVVRCGIGNWTAILKQPDLNFNKRSASNLKDRFRVCCPWAYGAADPNEATRQIQDTLANALINAESVTSGKIRLPDPRPKDNAATVESVEPSSSSKSNESSPPRKPKQSGSKSSPPQSHKSKSTLSSLGIPAPYFTKKSNRRSRRPFTPAEDEALLKGYAVHGFQWTLIQQDKHLNLSHRKATDLRDRFRTKFPSAYREGGSVSGKTLTLPITHSSGIATATTSAPAAETKQQSPLGPSSEPIAAGLASIASLPPPRPANQPAGNTPVDINNTSARDIFAIDDTATANASAGLTSASDIASSSAGKNSSNTNSWVDNTLPPLNWDDLP